ncbi:hypothetical protein ACFPLB_08890 [Aquamicrobium segne]|uniref:Lipoprotein n=1 Tax=Aquamicrobium segne TaxID=469547 RepID=A0ABW0GX22_9HYPH
MNRKALSILLPVMLSLSACTSPDSTRQEQTAANGHSVSPAVLQPAQAQNIRLQVAPVIGVSEELAAPLVENLQQQAHLRAIPLAGDSTSDATHILKGYFSVLNENGGATVISVWDIYDPSGNRLHRLSNQQKTQALNGAQGWPGIARQTLHTIAATSMGQLAIWLQTQQDGN